MGNDRNRRNSTYGVVVVVVVVRRHLLLLFVRPSVRPSVRLVDAESSSSNAQEPARRGMAMIFPLARFVSDTDNLHGQQTLHFAAHPRQAQRKLQGCVYGTGNQPHACRRDHHPLTYRSGTIVWEKTTGSHAVCTITCPGGTQFLDEKLTKTHTHT